MILANIIVNLLSDVIGWAFIRVVNPQKTSGSTTCIQSTVAAMDEFKPKSHDSETVIAEEVDCGSRTLFAFSEIPAKEQSRITADLRKTLAFHAAQLRTPSTSESVVNADLISEALRYITINFIVNSSESYMSRHGQPSAYGEGVMNLNAILRGNAGTINAAKYHRGKLRNHNWYTEMICHIDAILSAHCLDRSEPPHDLLQQRLALLICQETPITRGQANFCIDRAVNICRKQLLKTISLAKAPHPPGERWAWQDDIDRNLCGEVAYAAFLHALLTRIRNAITRTETAENDTAVSH